MITAYVTDCDGTLFDTEGMKSDAFGTLCEKIWDIEAKKAKAHWLARTGVGRRIKTDELRVRCSLAPMTDEEYESFNTELFDRLRDSYGQCQKYPGVYETLEFANTYFDHCIAFTGTPAAEMQQALEATGLISYFEQVYGTGLHPKLKINFPDKTSHLSHIKETYGPTFIVIAGDAEEDMRVGREAGAYCIGLDTTKPAEVLLKAGAQVVVKPDELKGARRDALESNKK